MTLHVIFDTSVLRPSTHQLLNSPEIEAIKNLAIAGRIKIHFPYIVENEFKTQRKSHYLNLIGDVSRKIEELYGDEKGRDGDFFDKLNKICLDVKDNKQRIAEEKISYIDEWINETGSVRQLIEPNDAVEVFERYFSGEIPFSGIKKRDDIPDAFIFQSVKNIRRDVKESEDVITIVNDKFLRKACQEFNIRCYSNLNEFIRSDEYKSLYNNHCIEKNLSLIQEKLLKYINENNVGELFSDYLSRKDVIDDILRQIKKAYPQLNDALIKGLTSQDISVARNINYIGGGIFTVFFNSKIVLFYIFENEINEVNVSQKIDVMSLSGRINISADIEKIESGCEKKMFDLDIAKRIEIGDLSIDGLEKIDKEIKEKEIKNKTIQPEKIESDFGIDEGHNVGYYVLNTNAKNNISDHYKMLNQGVAAAFYAPWKFYINQLHKNDIVFLYQSGVGIVACGKASGELKVQEYDDIEDNEHYMMLNEFCKLKYPISASEMKIITSRNFNFMRTMFRIDEQSGELILKVSKENCDLLT